MTTVSLSIGHTPNYATLRLGDSLVLYFSYSTPIAFDTPLTGTVVRENVWGPTTGKHLNAVDGGSAEAKKARISSDKFETQLARTLSGVSVK